MRFRFKYFFEDQTKYLRDDLVPLVGRYREIMVFNYQEIHHLCELTPSYECHPVDFVVDSEISDELYEELQSSFDNDPVYRHCSGVDRIAMDCPPPPDRFDDTDGEEYLQDCLEYYRCNAGIFGS